MNSSPLQKSFEKEGYLLLRTFFDKNELQTLKDTLQEAQNSIEKQSKLNQQGLIFHSNLFKYSTGLQNLIASKKVSGVIEELNDEPVWVRWDQTITKAPGGNPFPWHRDNVYNQLKAKHFQLWVALTPMNQQNGGLCIVPGSHKWGAQKHVRNLNHWEVEHLKPNYIPLIIEAEPGDVLIFSSFMLHKTGVNKSEYDRTAYVVEFMSQKDFDPKIEAPYLLVENGKAKMVKKHPAKKWYKPAKQHLIKKTQPKIRWI